MNYIAPESDVSSFFSQVIGSSDKWESEIDPDQ